MRHSSLKRADTDLFFTPLVSEQKSSVEAAHPLLHKIHDVFEVQVVIVVHNASPDVLVQQLHGLQEMKENKKKCVNVPACVTEQKTRN